jgi:hypothetical protein
MVGTGGIGNLRGSMAYSQAATAVVSKATATKVPRQPKASATRVPTGAPSAIESVIPPCTAAKARPRLSGWASTPASATAVGIYRPPARASSTRATTNQGKLGAMQATTLAQAKKIREASSSMRRSCLASQVARMGALMAKVNSKAGTSWPVMAGETARFLPMAGSTPAIMKASVPMANEPRASHRMGVGSA